MDDIWARRNRPDLYALMHQHPRPTTAEIMAAAANPPGAARAGDGVIAVARRYFFNAEHRVDGLAEPWCSRHEHSYTVEVVAEEQFPAVGTMVVDTDVLDRVAHDVIAPLDGTYLNDSTPTSTTVEELAAWMLSRFDAPVREVTVWEDDNRWGRARR